jgi:Helix-turn-helix domain
VSVEAITWAIDRDELSSGAKLLLLVIANSAGPDGVAYTGQAFLAKRCCCSKRTVVSQMQYLEERLLIARFERRHEHGPKEGLRTSDWIVLAPDDANRSPMVDADVSDYQSMNVIAAATTYRESSHEDASHEESRRVRCNPAQSQMQSSAESGEAG